MVLFFGVLGLSFLAFQNFNKDTVRPKKSVVLAQNDAGQRLVVEKIFDGGRQDESDGADAQEIDGGVLPDVAPPLDAAPPLDVVVVPPVDKVDVAVEEGERLRLTSHPKGAKVYLDGTLVGKTPIDLDPSEDQHNLALILEGYELYTGEVGGRDQVSISLKEVTPPEGPAGIKVRCRKKNRYYVFVDGNPVGQLCPTERIGVQLGRHQVEIYDPVTDARHAFQADVKDTRLSVRIRVD